MARKAENRKGEFREVFEEARKAGFARVRIDGVIQRLEDVTALDKKKKHTIEIVIDRVSIDPGERARLTDSVEAAVKAGGGSVLVAVEGEARERAYSEARACPDCGVGLPELSPQSFSFNSPLGMCVDCNGLGSSLEIDPDLVVPDPELSIGDGAIEPWGDRAGRDQGWTANVAAAVSREFGIPLDKPWKNLTPRQREIILFGAGEKRVKVTWNGQARRRIVGDALRGRRQHDQEAAAGDLVRGDAPVVRPLLPRAALPRVQGAAPAAGVAGRAAGGQEPGRGDGDDRRRRVASTSRRSGSRARARRSPTEILKEVNARLGFLLDVGLEYLTLDRAAATLSGGEAQRIRLASQLGSELSGVMYVLDEPSIGLHQRDNLRLIGTLRRLRDLGNSVIVVEHDAETIESADHVIDFGPGAGRLGGRVVAEGSPEQLKANDASLTGQVPGGHRAHRGAGDARRPPQGFLTVKGAREHNLKNIDVAFPLGVLVAVTGVSGAGKSSLINGILQPALRRKLLGSYDQVGRHGAVVGIDAIDKVIDIDQKPIGRTPRSNPATYTKAFDAIRDVFAQTAEARAYGYQPGRFSFNVKGGRCEACEGDGVRQVEMHFLPDVYVTCEVCRGKRYNEATLRVKWKDRTIAEVLETTVSEALGLFEHHRTLRGILQTLDDVGLGYIALGQSATTLSGGEAQRIKLSRELAKRDTGKTLYLLDEPTTGLHFEDVRKLLDVLDRLVDVGQHRARHRAQPRRHQGRRLRHRPRPRGRRPRRRGRRGRHARRDRARRRLVHRPVPRAPARRPPPPYHRGLSLSQRARLRRSLHGGSCSIRDSRILYLYDFIEASGRCGRC